MPVTAPVLDKADARVEKTFPYHLPTSAAWAEHRDFFGSATMMLAGGGMFMRNPLIIWTAMCIAVQQYVVQEPLRTNKDANSPLALLGMAVSGVIATSIPKVLLTPEPAAAAAAAVSSATTSA